jgi:hypothetical protein
MTARTVREVRYTLFGSPVRLCQSDLEVPLGELQEVVQYLIDAHGEDAYFRQEQDSEDGSWDLLLYKDRPMTDKEVEQAERALEALKEVKLKSLHALAASLGKKVV